jgi:hypothetical protein
MKLTRDLISYFQEDVNGHRMELRFIRGKDLREVDYFMMIKSKLEDGKVFGKREFKN